MTDLRILMNKFMLRHDISEYQIAKDICYNVSSFRRVMNKNQCNTIFMQAFLNAYRNIMSMEEIEELLTFYEQYEKSRQKEKIK